MARAQHHFTPADVWMSSGDIRAVHDNKVRRSMDGGKTWESSIVRDDEDGSGPRHAPGFGLDLQRFALNVRGDRGWAVSGNGDTFYFDAGAWKPAHELDDASSWELEISNDGEIGWVLSSTTLYRLSSTERKAVHRSHDGIELQSLFICPDGKSGWVRGTRQRWWRYDGARWTPSDAQPKLACITEACALAMRAEAGSARAVACARGGLVWSASSGQTVNGQAWGRIKGIEAVQHELKVIRIDDPDDPRSAIALTRDGALFKATAYRDQPTIAPRDLVARTKTVRLSWTLSEEPASSPEWRIERCDVERDDSCAADSDAWQRVGGVLVIERDDGYFANVDLPKNLSIDASVDYRVSMTLDGLEQPAVKLGRVTLGESPALRWARRGAPYAGGVAVWLVLIGGLWLVAPYALLRINDRTRQAMTGLPGIGDALGLVVGIAIAAWLVRSPRVVHAWIRRNMTAGGKGADKGFDAISYPALRKLYQGLDACQEAWMKLHRQQAHDAFDRHRFAIERRHHGDSIVRITRGRKPEEKQTTTHPRGLTLEIVRGVLGTVHAGSKGVFWILGRGGVGKSHLACQLARWSRTVMLGEPAIVLLLHEEVEDRKALLESIRRRLAAWTQANDIHAELVSGLLASGRLIPLWDGLSERRPQTVTAVKEYLESPEAPLLAVCTARLLLDLNARSTIVAEPMPLAATDLLPFLSSYRASLPAEERPDEDFAVRIRKGAVMIAGSESRTVLTPLLITLLWKDAAAPGSSTLPARGVDVFTRYVMRSVVSDDAEHAEPARDLALRRARVLARLALGASYQPGSWFSREAAIAALEAAKLLKKHEDPIKPFVSGGILEEVVLPVPTLRFVLDPLSEVLAALEILATCSNDQAKWSKFLRDFDQRPAEERERSAGFRAALEECCVAYGDRFGLRWPGPDVPMDDSG